MLPPLPPDPYKALGVDKRTQPPEIKKAHRALVLKCHPDKIQTDDPEVRAKKVAEFQVIQQAYELLMDEDKRRDYDDLVEKYRRQAQAHPTTMPNMSVPRGPVPIYEYKMHIHAEQPRSHIYTTPPRPPVFNDGKPPPRDDYVFVAEAGIRRGDKKGTPRKERGERDHRDRKTREEWDDEARRERERETQRGSSDRKKKREDKERDRKQEEKKHRQRSVDAYVPQESHDDDIHRRKSSFRKHEDKHRDRDRGRERSRRDRTPADEEKPKIQVEEALGYIQSQGSKIPGASASASGPPPASAPRSIPIPSVKSLGVSPPHVPTPPPPAAGLRRPPGPPRPVVEDVMDEEEVYRSRGPRRASHGMSSRSEERLGRKTSYSSSRDEPGFAASSPRAGRPTFVHSATTPPAVPDSPPNLHIPHIAQIRRAYTYHPEVRSHPMEAPRPPRRSETMNPMMDERGRNRSRRQSLRLEEEEDELATRRRVLKERSGGHRSSRRDPSPHDIYDEPTYRSKSSRTIFYEKPPGHSGVRVFPAPTSHNAYYPAKVKVAPSYGESDISWARYPADHPLQARS